MPGDSPFGWAIIAALAALTAWVWSAAIDAMDTVAMMIFQEMR